MIIQLGNFQFSISNVSYDAIQRATRWKWAEVPIVGSVPSLQYVGKESPTINISGTMFNYIARGDEIQALKNLADTTDPLQLTGDDGVFYGYFVIKSISEQHSVFRAKQTSPVKNEWSMELIFHSGDPDDTGVVRSRQPSTPSRFVATKAASVKASMGGMKDSIKELMDVSDDDEVSELKNIDEFSDLSTTAERDFGDIDSIVNDINAFENDAIANPDAPVASQPSRSGFFQSIAKHKGIIDKSKVQRRRIATTQRKARLVPGLSGTNAFGKVSKALKGYDDSIRDVANANTRKDVDGILEFKDFIVRAGGSIF